MVLARTLGDKYCYVSHFRDKETESPSGFKIMCLRSYNWFEVAEYDLNPGI